MAFLRHARSSVLGSLQSSSLTHALLTKFVRIDYMKPVLLFGTLCLQRKISLPP